MATPARRGFRRRTGRLLKMNTNSHPSGAQSHQPNRDWRRTARGCADDKRRCAAVNAVLGRQIEAMNSAMEADEDQPSRLTEGRLA
jgi:hypothetical protein